jgi:hypothetical protein
MVLSSEAVVGVPDIFAVPGGMLNFPKTPRSDFV